MARPIKETPVLKGKDALEFERAIEQNKGRKVSKESYQRALAAYKSIKQVSEASSNTENGTLGRSLVYARTAGPIDTHSVGTLVR